jgi:glycosyltransferase involved in cell wall biosynthesis
MHSPVNKSRQPSLAAIFISCKPILFAFGEFDVGTSTVMSANGSQSKYRLVIIVAEDWAFVRHFLHMARAARTAGFEVVVVANVQEHRSQIEVENFRLVHVDVPRGALGPVALIRYFLRIRRIIAAERPDVIHSIAMKGIIFGGLAAVFERHSAQLLSFTGLGYLWEGDGPAKRMARLTVRILVSWISRYRRTIITFENEDDRREFYWLKRATVIGGWGFDPDSLRPYVTEMRRGVVRIVFLGRMLRAKGIAFAIKAVQLARSRGCNGELELWGEPDPENPTSYTVRELEEFSKDAGVKWMGFARSVDDAWRGADIAILLSKREGMPRSLIEAAAAGLPMIATDVPGCRSVVRNGFDGILVPSGNVEAAAEAIGRLAGDAELRARMGRAARDGFEQRFTLSAVIPKILDLYLRLAKSNDPATGQSFDDPESERNLR